MSTSLHLNLLKITATISSTNTVIIDMVIIRFVAILSPVSNAYKIGEETVPTGHAPERLDAPVRVALAVLQRHARALDGLALPAQGGECVAANLLRLERDALALAQPAAAALK